MISSFIKYLFIFLHQKTPSTKFWRKYMEPFSEKNLQTLRIIARFYISSDCIKFTANLILSFVLSREKFEKNIKMYYSNK